MNSLGNKDTAAHPSSPIPRSNLNRLGQH